jgi:hypothetical protein
LQPKLNLDQEFSRLALPTKEQLWSASLTEILSLWRHVEGVFGAIGAARYLCRLDRFYLLTVACRRVDCFHPWLYARCREVERDPDDHLDLWARDHYKSTIITYAGCIQEILVDPEITIGIFSHTKAISRDKFLAQIKRELESNEILMLAYPDILYSNPQKDAPNWSLDRGITVKRQQNSKESTVEGHGLIDGMPTGAHFKLRVYDDVVVPESVGTPEQIAKTTTAWELSDNLGSAGGRRWHIGTRYSYVDSYDAIMRRGAIRPRIYAATDDGTITGRSVFLPQDILDAKIITQGQATFACQMLQNPLEGRQSLFDVTDLQRYEVRPEVLGVYIVCDPASSMKKDSDKTAIAVIGVDYAMNKYLLDGYNHKMRLEDRWQCLRAMVVKWVRAPGVQSVRVGYERYGATSDLEYFEQRMKVEGPRFDITELAWPREGLGSKLDRVQRLGPDIRAKRFYLPYDNFASPDGALDETGQPRMIRTRDARPTSLQRNLEEQGYGYRVAKAIRRKDADGNIYDLAEDFKMQAHLFPFGKKDLIDAVSRIYDMEATPPNYYQTQSLEPEYV